MKFPVLSTALVRELVSDEAFLGTWNEIGIDLGSWPDSADRAAAEAYLARRESNGHAFARHSLQAYRADVESRSFTEIPIEAQILRPLYWDSLEAWRAEQLALAILRQPSKADDLISEFQQNVRHSVKLKPISEWVGEYLPEREERIRTGTTKVRLPGFEQLSNLIGGFNPGRLGVLIADSGFGKTNLGIGLALAASRSMATVYFNMEMVPYDFTERTLVAMTETSYSELEEGRLDPSQAQHAAARRQLLVSDGSDLSVQQIKAAIRTETAKRKLGFVVVDYDQKLVLETSRDTQEWKALQRAAVDLESVAKSVGCFILLLAQSNDTGEISGSKRMKFGAATLMRFFNDELANDGAGQSVIQAVKNRFGILGGTLSVEYDASRAQIREIGRTQVTKRKPRGLV